MDRRTFGKLAGLTGMDVALRRSAALAEAQAALPGEEDHTNRALWDRYLLGTAYYPEWWDPSEWETDFREMHQLGFNTVRMGEFAWAIFEPAPGRFVFDWMDRALEIANRHGIRAVLATPTASVPPWLYQAHPDVLGGNERGPYTYGGRKGYCTNSSAYLEASARITTALAEHYGSHPGVMGWQLDNEPGYPFACFDPDSEKAFQLWLQKRYGTLTELNQAWNGAFWSNEYSDWSQIHIPKNSAEGGWQPAITLDYRRFFSDSSLHHLRRQATILQGKIRNQFLYTNWPAPSWSVEVFTAAEFLTACAWDNYVSAPGLSEFQHQYISGFNGDFCRCAGPQQRYLCAEQIAYVPANALDAGLRLQAYINLAHGCHGHLYFEWRRPLAGNEQFRPSFVKQFDGSINPAKPVFEQIGREFAVLGPRLAGATTRADIALLYDFDNSWSQGFANTGDTHRRYGTEVGHYYHGFKVLQRNVDVVPLSVDFAAYQLILAPNLHLVDDAVTQRLSSFVAAGGVLVLNYRAGTQHSDASMRRVLPPGVFTQIAGVRAEGNLDLVEYSGLEKSLKDALGIRFSGSETVFPPRTMLESLLLHGAEPMATFRGGRMAGKPAVTRHGFGKGSVVYVATDCDDDRFYEALARMVGASASLSPLIAAPYGVEVTSRESSGEIFYFLLNLTEETHDAVPLPHPMEDLIAGKSHVTQVALGPLEVAVLAAPRRGQSRRARPA